MFCPLWETKSAPSPPSDGRLKFSPVLTKEQLWAIVAAREGMTAEQVGQEARRLAREAHGAFFGILDGAEGVEA